jgi:hypothetical protein
VPRWLVGLGHEREAELVVGCPAAAAGEVPPASGQLEQTNKRAQELQGGSYGVGSNTCWRGKAGGVEVTVRHPWRTAAARHPREEGPAGFIAVCKAVEAMAWAPS